MIRQSFPWIKRHADGLIPGIVVFVGAIVFLLLYRINNEEAEKIQAVLSERRETAENET